VNFRKTAKIYETNLNYFVKDNDASKKQIIKLLRCLPGTFTTGTCAAGAGAGSGSGATCSKEKCKNR